MPNIYGRQIQDANFIVTTAFPAAAGNANSAAINLQSVYSQPERLELSLSWPAMSALADTKNVIFKVQHSADGSSYSDLGITKTITGAGGVGVAAGEYLFKVPSNSGPYFRINAAEDSAGGNITASNFVFKALF